MTNSHILPCNNPNAVQTAIRSARSMLDGTCRRLGTAAVNVPEDPRIRNQLHNFFLLFFKVEPGLTSSRQILQIKENSRYLQQAANLVNAVCVATSDPMCGRAGQMGHSGYAVIGTDRQPTVYLCPSFFRQSPADQARVIIHELAHARLNVTHEGGRFFMGGCHETPLRNFREAINNAYVYDAFAFCLSSVPTH